MTLNITINETVHTVDGIVEALNYIDAKIRDWYDGQDEKPLTITLTKNAEPRGPPTLSIHVEDDLPVLSILR